ncbi:hypothetical protein HYFRA_00004464 [Hymenoscyphus fraxineus]|uniref:Uncharacterized protein n=1 Tax=Hymenoscyphus fraxineus TaxID=746836 RepID=A0A9N9PTI0_9HELO|nr:hypothetical protein HYFRA_00004464 [Hymenoscyphus fraxineus]
MPPSGRTGLLKINTFVVLLEDRRRRLTAICRQRSDNHKLSLGIFPGGNNYTLPLRPCIIASTGFSEVMKSNYCWKRSLANCV